MAFVGNYPPRLCGIATFTQDLSDAVAATDGAPQCFVIPITDEGSRYRYPQQVRFQIQEHALNSYEQAAEYLNVRDVDLVSLQHEFGIYGGADGRYVLHLMERLRMPVVTTMHTVIQDPTDGQREVSLRLADLSERIVVMAERGREILLDEYDVDGDKIDVIPHGIPDVPFVDPNFYKHEFGVEGRLMLLTFGLLSPNKGIEDAIQALPRVVEKNPDVVYIVLGATHPNLLRAEGEAYRERLQGLARKLDLNDNVVFYNDYVPLEKLKRFIGAADIYITPYLNEAQITSGTLAYAVGAGKPVVSTPYWHAQELLAGGRGSLVPFSNPQALGTELGRLIADERGRHAMRRAAYEKSREMVWARVAERYVESFEHARRPEKGHGLAPRRASSSGQRALPTSDLRHISRMTDSTGMWQHARFSVPRFEEGYCTDDNARSLLLTVVLERTGGAPRETWIDLRTANLAFLNAAFDSDSRRFRNFLSFDRRWLEDGSGSEDSHARALWGLGYCAGHTKIPSFRTLAANLFLEALPAVAGFSSPRAWAYTLLGAEPYLQHFPGDVFVESIREQMTDHLIRTYDSVSAPDWPWFELCLAYANARLPEALLISGHHAGESAVVETALRSLAWLMRVQTGETGCFSPIGSEDVYHRGGERHHFDQQPIEAHASASACLAAWRITGDDLWFQEARRAIDWFLGANDIGLPLYDPASGGCRDGLHIDRVNENFGAESTLAFQLALADLRLAEMLSGHLKPPTSGLASPPLVCAD